MYVWINSVFSTSLFVQMDLLRALGTNFDHNQSNGMNSPRMTWDPGFRETENVDILLAGLLNQSNGLTNTRLKIKLAWLCLNCADFDCRF